MAKMVFPEYLSWIGSVVAMLAFVRGILPRHYADYVTDRFVHIFSPYAYFVVHAVDSGHTNELYQSVKRYLGSLTSERALVSNIAIRKNAKRFTFGMANNQRIRDTFNGVAVEWQCKPAEGRSVPTRGGDGDDRCLFEMRVWRAYKDFVLEEYITYITEKAAELERTNRQLRLYSNRRMMGYPGRSRGWDYIPFRHPATFDTIAMKPELKLSILKDLHQFVHGEEFYKRIGKAWKRGYLLYGPPGTGKTSIVAAMARELNYDIYDLELTEVNSNAELRNLLVFTESKSIIVIEDIDCSMDLAAQRRKRAMPARKIKLIPDADEERGAKAEVEEDPTNTMTLSGLLNFLDGLWSCCEDERIFVFTTNYVNKLDEALLRSGRMDMHISLSYIEFPAFRELAEKFLQIEHHDLFGEVEELLNNGSSIAPSEVAEILMRNRDDADAAIEQLVRSLHGRMPKPSPPEPKPKGATPEEAEHSVSGGKQPPEKDTVQS